MKNSVEAAKELHQSRNDFGAKSDYSQPSSMKYNLFISETIQKVNIKNKFISSILDYGTGQGGLPDRLRSTLDQGIKVEGYDPAIEQYATKPTCEFDLVTSIDVLEHIPIQEINTCLNHIKSLTNKFFFFAIDLMPASKKLADKRNAHLLIAPSDWWAQKLKEHFRTIYITETGHLPNGDPHPNHLFGCATNNPQNAILMSSFLNDIDLVWKKWTWTGKGGCDISNY